MNGPRKRTLTTATRNQVSAGSGGRLLSVDKLLALPPLTWLIDQYLPAGGLAVLYGPSGSGKSFVALDMGLSIATGIRWAGFATKSGPVVYVSAEGSAGLPQRVDAWLQARGVESVDKDKLQFCIEPIHVMDGREIRRFIQDLELELPCRPSLVIFDTMARCMVGGDENSSRDMGQFVEGLEQVRKSTGAAVLIVHHTGKNGTTERGSTALRAAADVMLSLQVRHGTIRLEVDKVKDAPATAPALYLRLKQHGNSCVVTLTDGHTGRLGDLTKQQRRALETLARLSDACTASEWQAQSSIPESSFYRVIRQLQDMGYVAPNGEGKGYVLTNDGRSALTLT